MKFTLKEFQTRAVDELVEKLRKAAVGAMGNELQSVCLASPTGSGKTIIVTAAIEKILQGDDAGNKVPDAVFLWLTDQPELNEQTRRKMLASSTVLGANRLVVIDSQFDSPTLYPGHIHFLNIQKLGKEKALVTIGDGRANTIWDTVRNTVAQFPGRFFLIIDEAHRGMVENGKAKDEAQSIVQRFIKSSHGDYTPVPLIVGVSATPERFYKLMHGAGRARRDVTITPEDVRESGLLKEVITLYHPAATQPADVTLLQGAVETWRTFTLRWKAYQAQQSQASDTSEPEVTPILVIQVEDGDAKHVSKTDLATVMTTIREATGLGAEAFAHAFQEGAAVTVGDLSLRYIPPADIQDDPNVRIVFFKTSLSTGWDCPRAEVMMSFRAAKDPTSIAQLIGRMVRTPLARRVDTDEYLNTVALYLPHYDKGRLQEVIDHLARPDPENMPPGTVIMGEEAVTLVPATDAGPALAALSSLPTYVVPKSRRSSEIRRLMKLARLLSSDDIDPEATDQATKAMLDVLQAEYDRLKNTKDFKKVVEAQGKVEVRAVQWRVGTDASVTDDDPITLDIADENLVDVFETAGRKLGEGLHKAWWRARGTSKASGHRVKRELIALCLDAEVLRKVEATARQIVQGWLKQHQSAIAALADGQRQAYDDIRRLATEPELTSLVYPTTVGGRVAPREWPHHVFVAPSTGLYPAVLNTWETLVLDEVLARDDTVAWLRNPPSKPWSLCVPYQIDGDWHALYPDFLVVRRAGAGVVVDLLDPHALNLADAPDKALGLARYADKHAHQFGRIETIIVEGDAIRRLDLADEATRDRVKAVKTDGHLRQLFKDA